MNFKFLGFGLILMVGFFSFTQTLAQQESTSILMNVVPANPNPGENVTITLSSYAENLDSAEIFWFVNAQLLTSGVGKKTVIVKTPDFGSELKILARIKTLYEESQVSTVIKPSQMVLLWEAVDSYVPPFYKGKALPAPDTFVKVVAIPDIRIGNTQIDPRTLTYNWQKDFNNDIYGSGYGKNYYIFKNDYLENSNSIGVTAYSTDQKYSAQNRINIGMINPFINFYRQDPSLGIIWEHTISNGYFVKNNDTLIASPYFISPKEIRSPELVFKWSINDLPLFIPDYKKTYLPIAVEEGSSGISNVELEIESTAKIFQNARKEINISF